MAIRSGFFNSVDGDRRYDANRFGEYFASFIGNGVFPNPSDNLQVISNNDMTVSVRPGKAWINGYILINDDDYILNLEIADGVLSRIDRIVIRYDVAQRDVFLGVKQGTFASSPVAPNLQRDADAYELALADILVSNGSISITQANIIDLRLNNELCGIVHGTVDQVDTTTIFNQYQAWFNSITDETEQDIADWQQQQYDDFMIWFQSIQDILEGDVAANLTSRISSLENDFTSHLADYANFKNNIEAIDYNEDKLFLKIDGEWVEFKFGSQYPVGNITDFSAKSDDKKVVLNWQDPEDVTIADSNDNIITIARWKGTKILRKTGSYPVNEHDGVLVVDNGIRNQYLENGFTDTGLQNDVEYFYMAFPYTEEDVYTVDESNRISATPTEIKIYGIEIDESNSNPETSVVYTDDAVGFIPASGNNGAFNWGSWQAIFNDIGIKPCLLKNGVVQYYLNPNDFTKKADGSNADITSGNDGDVMIEFPKIYWKINRVGTKLYVKYSTKQFEGSINSAHKIGSAEKDKIYLSAYMGNEISGKLRSLSGKSPTVNKTIGAFRTAAQANGAGYQQTTYYALLMLQVLYTVWFKNLNSQTALGRGYVDGNSASINTGGTNTKGMFYGETSGKLQNKFCGIEDFWGNVYYWIDGLYSDTNRNIMISRQNVFNDNGTGYSNHGVGATANIGGYINKVQGGNETGFIIKEKDGSSSTYYADYGYLTAEYLPRFGGAWNYGDSAGAFRLRVFYSASSSSSAIGARSCFIGS